MVVSGCSGATTLTPSHDPVTSPSAIPWAMSTPTLQPTAPTETAQPTAVPLPTDVPTEGVWDQDPPEPLLLGAAVRVVVGELNIRAGPSTSAKLFATFEADEVIIVRDIIPPVEADGFVWYQGDGPFGDGTGELPPLPQPADAGIEPVSGWFAATEGTKLFVKPAPARCPTSIDVKNLGAMLPAERLSCFGDRSIEFKATYAYGCPTCEYFGRFDPAWLASPNEVNYVTESGIGVSGLGLNVRVPPALVRPENGSWVSVHGHFDDPAARDCSISLTPWDYRDMRLDRVPGSIAKLWCRQQLVVEKFDVLGIDASYDGDP